MDIGLCDSEIIDIIGKDLIENLISGPLNVSELDKAVIIIRDLINPDTSPYSIAELNIFVKQILKLLLFYHSLK